MIIGLDFLGSDGQGTETMHREFLNVGLEPFLNLLGPVAGANVNHGAGHTLGDALGFPGGSLTAGTLSMFVCGDEWLEVEDLDSDMCLEPTTDGALVFHTRSGGSQVDDIVDGEGTISPDGLVINGGDTGDDGIVLGKLLSPTADKKVVMAVGIPLIKRTRMLSRPSR